MKYIALFLKYFSINDLDSFQNGVDLIVNKCIELGSTPNSNIPEDIITSIEEIYENRYNVGSNMTYSHKFSMSKSGSYAYYATNGCKYMQVSEYINSDSDHSSNIYGVDDSGNATFLIKTSSSSGGTFNVSDYKFVRVSTPNGGTATGNIRFFN